MHDREKREDEDQHAQHDVAEIDLAERARKMAVAVVLHVPPSAFAPPPRVDSAVVVLRPRATAPCRFEALEKIAAERGISASELLGFMQFGTRS